MCPNCVHGPVMGKTCVRGREEPGAGARIVSRCPGSAVSTGLSRCLAEATYERTLSVDGEETTLLVMDTWEPEQRVRQAWAGCCGEPMLRAGLVSWDVPGGIAWA